MHKAVENIIDKLIGAVRSDKPYYSLKDLRSAGFPSFVVERIRIEIELKLKDEFELHATEWSETDHKKVQSSWNQFLEALYSKAHIPSDQFYAVISRVMTEIISVYLEPRQLMADYIFKGDQVLNYDELVKRTDRLTIYKHFGRAIPLYMKKRKLDTLDVEKCKNLIQNLDASITASYSPADWAQTLDLLFLLFGGKLDPKLLHLFFGAKGYFKVAQSFYQQKDDITKAKLQEILQEPDLLNADGQDAFKEQYWKDRSKVEQHFDEPDEVIIKETIDEEEQELLVSFFNNSKDLDDEIEDEESINALFKTEESEPSLASEFAEQPESGAGTETVNDKQKTEKNEFRQNLAHVLDQAADSFNNLSKEEEEVKQKKNVKKEEPPQEKTADSHSIEDINQSMSDLEDEDLLGADEEQERGAMWQQFLRPDQMDVLMGSTENEKAKTLKEEAESEIDDEAISLMEHLSEQEKEYVKEIFNGKKKEYKKSLLKIQEMDSWERASEFLEKGIFSKPNVDMFSDAAVSFMDRLQAYFEEYKT